jgi:hypothetical protein
MFREQEHRHQAFGKLFQPDFSSTVRNRAIYASRSRIIAIREPVNSTFALAL